MIFFARINLLVCCSLSRYFIFELSALSFLESNILFIVIFFSLYTFCFTYIWSTMFIQTLLLQIYVVYYFQVQTPCLGSSYYHVMTQNTLNQSNCKIIWDALRDVAPFKKHKMTWNYNLKYMKNTHGGVLLLINVKALTWNFTKSNFPP